MKDHSVLKYLAEVVNNVPADWLNLTTHRLDIYNEDKAKTEFLQEFEALSKQGIADREALNALPTAYDYIRLGHPLSTVLEWAIAKLQGLEADRVISFASRSMPVLAILRTNLLEERNTRIVYHSSLPAHFDADTLREVYHYNFELLQAEDAQALPPFEGSTIFISPSVEFDKFTLPENIDFWVSDCDNLGSIILLNEKVAHSYISAIQHVRRRESIAMTPQNCLFLLQFLLGRSREAVADNYQKNLADVRATIREITATQSKALLGSSGLSVQYAIVMGLIEYAMKHYPEREIKLMVPPNCYGGTNDQARRVAAANSRLQVMDLPVDRDNDMVSSVDKVLDEVAARDAVPLIIVEIPTNPRVEVPDLQELSAVLSRPRTTPEGGEAVSPVFIIDQTFCPNVQFLKQGGIFSDIRAISYVSGSKFPSGGKCTAGYTVSNILGEDLMAPIEKHLALCDNQATPRQVEILAAQMPSMNERIAKAYANTREFVSFIRKTLPAAKINFVSEELAAQGFTPSVFSLDLPTRGDSAEAREAHKRQLNQRLIDMMITRIPEESKYCVSYGQLKGCYWTIPATSTQGTTKESDKDYIARVSVSPDLDLALHKKVFVDYVESMRD